MEKIIVELQEHNGELVLPLPDNVMSEVGLEVGDTVEFSLREDDSVVLSKQKIFLVKERVIFENTYAVYAPDAEAAKEKVQNIEPTDAEISQRCVHTYVDEVFESSASEVVRIGQSEYPSWSPKWVIEKLTIGRGEEIVETNPAINSD
jgi:antitoxin component of MazEF toxin-antitoxin module